MTRVRIDVLTVFPAYLQPLDLSLIGKAQQQGMLQVHIHDLRDFTHDRHRTVDDAPLGGGAGMVMKPEPWIEALHHVRTQGQAELGQQAQPVVIFPNPAGAPFTQAAAHDLAAQPWLIFGCGRYEGIDERVYEYLADQHWHVALTSLGDYVLNGGEVAALAIIEAVGRLIPGVIGNAESLVEESHSSGLLEYPLYTRPAAWVDPEGIVREAPSVLLSGHHQQIAQWRTAQAEQRTQQRRPDLWERRDHN